MRSHKERREVGDREGEEEGEKEESKELDSR